MFIKSILNLQLYVAQTIDISPLPNGGGGDRAQRALDNALNITFGVLAVVAILMIVINGLKYINSNGDSNKMAEARMGVLYSLIGLIVVVAARLIVGTVINAIS